MKRLFSTITALAMAASLCMSALPVYAVDETAETPVCTCTELCTEGAVNDTCPVCAEDLTQCAGKAAEAPADSEGEPEAETPVCTCTEQCTEGAVNEACPVCAEDLTQCAGKAVFDGEQATEGLVTASDNTLNDTTGALQAPASAAPVLMNQGTGASPEDPMQVPDEGLVIKNGVYYGVSRDWFKTVSSGQDDVLYFSITIPATVTTVASDGFRDSYSSEKTNQGAVTYYDNIGRYSVVAIDFSQASELTTIKSQAAMGCPLSGVLDLSKTKITTLEKSAFNGCTGLTGVILPATLEVLGAVDGSSGSVFNGCAGLQFVRTAGGDANTAFELPQGLRVIGKQTFKDTFSKGADLKVHIPASVEIVGSEAFYSNSAFSQIFVERDGDLDGYNSGAFKAASTADCLLILPDSAAYQNTGSFTRVTKTFPVTLVFNNGQSVVAEQKKLFNQSIQYTLDEAAGYWCIDPEYTLPETGDVGSTPGYDAGWMLPGVSSVLTNTSKVTGQAVDSLEVTVKKDVALSNPTVQYTVNGTVVQNSASGVQQLDITVSEDAPGTVGVQVTHPLATQEARDSGTYVYFQYCWWDEVENSVSGPRSQEEPELFSSSETSGSFHRVFTDAAAISIRNRMDARVDGDYYLVEVYGYYVENNGTPKQFYKSGHNFIAGQDGTVPEAFVMNVQVEDTTPVVITPADITIYTGGSGHYGVVDGSGTIDNEYGTNGFPEPGYYVSLPESLNALVGGDDYAENLSDELTLRYNNNGTTREWKLTLYGTADNSTDVAVGGQTRARYIYKLLPSTQENTPVRVQIRDRETGETVLSDSFTPSMEEKFKEYDMSIYPGALNQNFVTAELVVGNDTYVCPVSVVPGKLTVRGLNQEVTTEIVTGEQGTPDNITASAPADVTYFVNGSHVEVAEPEHVKLLVDTVLNEDVLTDYIEANILESAPDRTIGYEQRYLDLVDTKNGNVFLTMGEGQQMTLYWPVPKDYVAGGMVSVYHFEALDRNYDASVDKMLQDNPPLQIIPTLVTIDGQDYFKFETGSFSPFVLAYERKADGSGSDSSSVNSSGNTPAKTPAPAQNVSAAAAPAAQAAAAVIPQTGDDSQPLMWVVLAAGSLGLLAVLLAAKRRRTDK